MTGIAFGRGIGMVLEGVIWEMPKGFGCHSGVS